MLKNIMATAKRKAWVGRALLAALTLIAATTLVTCGNRSAAQKGQTRAAQKGQTRPNILVLMTDDQTLESVRVMSNVKRLLADKGTTFSRSFVSFALCCPSRATFFTGQYAHNHGVLNNTPPAGGYAKLDKSNWLPLWLQRAGYRTMHLGKFLNGYGLRTQGGPTEVPPGFNDWQGSIDPTTYNFWLYTLNENGTLKTYGARNAPTMYQTDFYGQRASDLIAAAAPSPQPFFFSVAFLAPHAGFPREPGDPRELTPVPAPRHRDRFASEPLPTPPSFNEADVSDKPVFVRNRPLLNQAQVNATRENYQQRLESLLSVDDAVAGIVNALERAGELDNTLIIFTSDNGFFHGEHRLPGGKIHVYEPSIRVPLILRGPGVPRGARRRQLVTNADLAPTILDAADAAPGRSEDGRSLFPLLRDKTLEWGRDIFIEGVSFSAIRTYRYVYVEYKNGEQELYDLEGDPFELQSRHADPSYDRLKAMLAGRLANLRPCGGHACRTRPHVSVRVRRRGRRCRVRVRGRAIDQVDYFKSGHRVARERKRPFSKRIRVRRGRLRVRVRTTDWRYLTRDTRLRRRCR